jgi:hypothetical protein
LYLFLNVRGASFFGLPAYFADRISRMLPPIMANISSLVERGFTCELGHAYGSVAIKEDLPAK